MTLAVRVLARFLLAQEEEAPKSTSKGGVPARWQEFLDKVHHGGREKVKNPNPKTQSRFTEVSYSTALKYPKFFLEAMKEYREWAKKNPEEKGKDTKKAPAAEKKTPLPSSIPKADVKRVFGDDPPSVEDFEEMFNPGEGHKAKITSIRHVKTAETNDFDFEGEPAEPYVKGSIEVNFELHDKNGKVIGHGARNFNVVDGKKAVFHQELKLDEALQGKGIGKNILKNSMKSYLKKGLDRVALNAAWVGRYTWARMGFDTDPKTFEAMKADFRKHLRSEVGLGTKEADRILDACKTMHNLSSVRIDGEHAGKDFLLSKRAMVYSGQMDLTEDDPGFKVAKGYLGL